MPAPSRGVPKARRQRVLLALVGEAPHRSQIELASALAERGIRVSQGTLSRDLRELGIVKDVDGYRLAAETFQRGRLQAELARALRRFLLGMQTAGSLVVLHTAPGGASALARALDDARLLEIVGTIAGDDTIFAATSDPEAARRVRARLDSL